MVYGIRTHEFDNLLLIHYTFNHFVFTIFIAFGIHTIYKVHQIHITCTQSQTPLFVTLNMSYTCRTKNNLENTQ